MNTREVSESYEDKALSRFAKRSCDATRKEREEKSELLTSFQVDVDRIIHSESFRKLKHKTQVFLSPLEDYFRTRLTHTLAVSHIARVIGRALWLNGDLIEAIALSHDLGHTPFGHVGEKALDRVSSLRFHHQSQSLRVVDFLENKRGLNLTDEVRTGIIYHAKGDRDLPERIGPLNKKETLESAVVRISDSIAYINHDIDDSIVAGIITSRDLPMSSKQILGNNFKIRTFRMIKDIINSSSNKPYIAWSKRICSATNGLKDFLYTHVYRTGKIHVQMQKAEKIIIELYKTFKRNTDLLKTRYRNFRKEFNIERTITDYIAGMSDREAIALYEELFVPVAWKS